MTHDVVSDTTVTVEQNTFQTKTFKEYILKIRTHLVFKVFKILLKKKNIFFCLCFVHVKYIGQCYRVENIGRKT